MAYHFIGFEYLYYVVATSHDTQHQCLKADAIVCERSDGKFSSHQHPRQTASRWVKVGDKWTKCKTFDFHVILKNLPEGKRNFSG